MADEQDENFEDLIHDETVVDWDVVKREMHEMPTSELMEVMAELEIFVNRQLALEIAGRADAVFHLRKLLQDGQSWQADLPGDGWAPIHAIHVLALVKSKDALELLLDVVRYRGDDLSDWLTDDMPAIFVAFGEDVIDRLKEFTMDETLEAFARASGTTALVALARKFPSHKNAVMEHLVKLLNSTKNAEFAGLVAEDLASFHEPSVLPEIYRAFEEGRIDESLIGKKDIETLFGDTTYDYCFEIHTKDPLNHFSRENIERLYDVQGENEISDWLDKDGEPEGDETKGAPSWRWEPDPDDANWVGPEEPTVNEPKIGRNDPCPCGSGKKFKKCCMNMEAVAG